MTEKIPTSGRTVIKADGTSEYIRYYDQPLTKEEQAATEWFHVLSPNEQYREARRLKWNLDAAQGDVATWKRVAQERDAEIMRLRLALAQFTPEGYVFPPAAAALIDHADAHGWKTAKAWTVAEKRSDDGDDWMPSARLEVHISHTGWLFKLSWSCEPGGKGRMGRGLARAPRRNWYDAPSLTKIRETIVSVGSEGDG